LHSCDVFRPLDAQGNLDWEHVNPKFHETFGHWLRKLGMKAHANKLLPDALELGLAEVLLLVESSRDPFIYTLCEAQQRNNDARDL